MNRDEAGEVLTAAPLDELETLCCSVRDRLAGSRVDLCSIINARKGACGEDCAFCAQSRSPGLPMLALHDLSNAHKAATEAGIGRFSAVTSGKGPEDHELRRICEMALGSRGLCSLCVSLGILDTQSLKKLKQSGVTRYHHNLETSRNYFPKICSTHTWDERADTIRSAKSAGLEVCSGGIFGLGETDEDRMDLAFSLAELEVDSVALNFFTPVSGIRINPEKLSREKMLRIIAMFRLVNPGWEVRICAGRSGLGDFEERIFNFGATGIMTGELLTTEGSHLNRDLELISRAGFTP